VIRVEADLFDTGAEIARFCGGRTDAGALAVFVGSVRDLAGDAGILKLELEHYEGYTQAEIARIDSEARSRFELLDTLVVHRYGSMSPGEPIVLVACLSLHRRAAIDAVDYLMDRLKTEAPFWKREIRTNSIEWIEPRADDRVARSRWEKENRA
jgi:molybdopterin synthase catalytic subunit